MELCDRSKIVEDFLLYVHIHMFAIIMCLLLLGPVLAQQLHSEMGATLFKDWDKSNCVFKSLCQVNVLFSMHV